MKKIVLENTNKETVRTFYVQADEFYAIIRKDNGRLELHHSLTELQQAKVEFLEIGKYQVSQLAATPIFIDGLGQLRATDKVSLHITDEEQSEENSSTWRKSLASVSAVIMLFVGGVLSMPRETPKLEEELKQHVVKIIKRTPKPVLPAQVADRRIAKKAQNKKQVKKSVKRLGALAVLGRLNKRSKNIGGVNLGALKTSKGPGLGGGTKGSGGVQTSLYAKGLIAAPVGPGANVKGAGGYGTKGKGGGQDGYGKMSLVGSTGTASIPLGKEAIIQGGLDQDLIAQVIAKNMGQVRFCYEQGLQANPKLTGRVAVDFTIGGNGRVKTAGLKNTTLHSSLVEQCILLRLKTWKFPVPEGGVDVRVSYPFLLKRLGSG